MQEYKFEIVYLYQPFKENPARTHYMYFACKAKSLESAKELAQKHYTSRMSGLGWTRYTTLTEIRPPKRANDPPNHKSVSSDTLPSKRSKSSSTGNTKRKSGTTTRSTRKSPTTKRKPKTK